MEKFRTAYERVTQAWRLTLGIPVLLISVLLTVIYMNILGHIHPEFIILIVAVWFSGFFSRGLLDATVDALEEFWQETGMID